MLNKNRQNQSLDKIQNAKLNIYKQAAMIVLAFVVTIVLIFAMSVAWYSNVIHTDDLVFQTAEWEFTFEGNVSVGSDPQTISPGDTGIVSLSLENQGDSSIAVLANVTKDTESFNESMKKRIYFYVDDSQVINDETVDRIYINETDEYKYTVLPKNTLTLSEEYHSDPLLKWEWVYDVLGYYVMGTMDTNGQMTVEDYMRPIVYDYDTATYDPTTGKLLTVNNGTPVKDFLTELYTTDGYAGSYLDEGGNAVVEENYGYYPVVVDEATGYGIWLYLCTQEEIEAAIAWDSSEYTKDINGSFAAKLLLTGQQAEENSITVGNASELKEALNSGEYDKAILSGDFEITEPISVSGSEDVVLDLNGSTLTLNTSSNVGFEVQEGSSLTVINGTMAGKTDSESAVAVKTVGGKVTLSGVTVTNAARGVNISDDSAASGTDSVVKITNCNFDVSIAGVFVRGNGTTSARQTTVVLENTTINSDGYGVAGNGSDSAVGTDIEISGCTITGAWSGIYHPQKDSYMKIVDSTITGETAIAIKGGTMDIEDTTVCGTGTKKDPAFTSSGYTSTGAALYAESGYGTQIVVNVTGDKDKTVFRSTYSEAIQKYDPNNTYVTITVTGGKFSSDVTDFLAEGYTVVNQSDGTYEVGQTPKASE